MHLTLHLDDCAQSLVIQLHYIQLACVKDGAVALKKLPGLFFLGLYILLGLSRGRNVLTGFLLPGTTHMFKPGDGLTNLRGLVIVLIR